MVGNAKVRYDTNFLKPRQRKGKSQVTLLISLMIIGNVTHIVSQVISLRRCVLRYVWKPVYTKLIHKDFYGSRVKKY